MSLSWAEAARLSTRTVAEERLRHGVFAACAAVGTCLLLASSTVPAYWTMITSPAESSVVGAVLWDRTTAPWTIGALLLAAVPVLNVAAQGVRVGAPQRDRRLAALRSAGAGRADVRRVVQAEAVVWCAVGAVLGVALYGLVATVLREALVVTVAADLGDPDQRPQDLPILFHIWPEPGLTVVVLLAVPLVAAALCGRSTRRVETTVRGQTARERLPSPRLAGSVVAFTLVGAALAVALVYVDLYPGGVVHWWSKPLWWVASYLPVVVAVMVMPALALLAPFVARRVGTRLIGSGSATALLAGSWMLARPRASARTAASLVVVAYTGGLAITFSGVMRGLLDQIARANGYETAPDGMPTLGLLTYSVPADAAKVLVVVAAVVSAVGLTIAVSEQVSTRRRVLARLIAQGVPVAAVRRALVLETVTPAALLASLSLAAGALPPVVAVVVAGHADLLRPVSWCQIPALWLIVVGGSWLAAHVASRQVRSTAEARLTRVR